MVPTATMGVIKIYDTDHPPIYTLEEPWLNNKRSVSCIPKGIYLCEPHSGPKFKQVYEITKVTGRSSILMHCGNTLKDTEGCILLGLSCGNEAVYKSRAAMALLKSILGEEAFMLQIQEYAIKGVKKCLAK